MNATVAILAIAAGALLLITESLSAPLARNTRSLGFNKFTCLPKQGPTYSKRDWKSCQKIPNHMLPPQTHTKLVYSQYTVCLASRDIFSIIGIDEVQYSYPHWLNILK